MGITEEEWKSILLPEERISWQLAVPRNDRLYHIRLNLIILFFIAPILISIIVILPVALIFDSTSTWLLGSTAFLLFLFICFRRRRRPLFVRSTWGSAIFEIKSIPYARLESVEVKNSHSGKCDITFLAQNDLSEDPTSAPLDLQKKCRAFSICFPRIPSVEVEVVERLATQLMKQHQTPLENLGSDSPSPFEFDTSLDMFPVSKMERYDLTTINQASIDAYFREQTRSLYRSSSSSLSLSQFNPEGSRVSAAAGANVLWSHQDSLCGVITMLALDYAFVVVLLELLMLGIIACSTAISARDHDEEYHTTSDNGGLDDVHPGIPIGFTFMVLFLALFYPFREMSAFGQGFFGRRLHVISANSAKLVYVHHSGLFNGLGTISFANMFPLQTTVNVGNGSGSISPVLVEMPGFWDSNVRQLELMIWKLFFREHLRKLRQTPEGELSPYLLRSPSGSGMIEGITSQQGERVEVSTMTLIDL